VRRATTSASCFSLACLLKTCVFRRCRMPSTCRRGVRTQGRAWSSLRSRLSGPSLHRTPYSALGYARHLTVARRLCHRPACFWLSTKRFERPRRGSPVGRPAHGQSPVYVGLGLLNTFLGRVAAGGPQPPPGPLGRRRCSPRSAMLYNSYLPTSAGRKLDVSETNRRGANNHSSTR
jgi:hypothetical protein